MQSRIKGNRTEKVKEMTTRTLKYGVYVFVLLLTLLNAYVFIHPVTAQTDPAIVVDFRQCANDDLTHGFVFDECHWINSIIQSSNSIYFEGNSVDQRIILSGLDTSSSHTYVLHFEHQFTKAGVHAYDFLTSYVGGDGTIDLDQGNGPALSAGLNPCGDEIGPPGTLAATCTSIHTNTHTALVTLPTDTFNSADGGSVACPDPTVQVSTKIAAFELTYGSRQVKIFGDAAISGATISPPSHVTSNGATLANCQDTGDSYAEYALQWTTQSGTVMIELAGHLANNGVEAPPGAPSTSDWGSGEGSSSISGGPYHFKLMSLDIDASPTSLGSQDNQIKGATILVPPPEGTATLVISKDTGQTTIDDLFGFTGTGETGGTSACNPTSTLCPTDISAFSIQTSGGSGQQQFDITFNNGAYSVVVTETSLPAGWVKGTASCSNTNDPTTGITLNAGDVVSCVFSNTPPPIPEYPLGLSLLVVAFFGIYMILRRRTR
jgi:hypothetical protein